jgi:hypothetical protein
MKEKTVKALGWIAAILNKHNVPYRIGGGFAAHVYGSSRPVNDIDITLPGKYFAAVLPEISEYITWGPKQFSGEKWEGYGLTLNYYGQEIDITDIDILRMSNLALTDWFQTKDVFRTYEPIMMNVYEIDIVVIDPRDLIAYKKHMDGGHQQADVKAVEKYITMEYKIRSTKIIGPFFRRM